MQKSKTFFPDHPYLILFYAGLLISCVVFILLKNGSFLSFSIFSFAIVSLFVFNAHLWRLEVSDKGVSGPGFYGPSTRYLVPWDKLEIRFVRNRLARYLVLRNKETHQEIRVARMNFSSHTLDQVKYFLLKHQGHMRIAT